MKVIAKNKQAYFDYEVVEKFEAGMVLTGQEVKSMKLGRINLAGSYVILRSGEVYLINATVSPYQPQNTPKDHNPTRPRKLLLRKTEIRYLIGKSKQKGLTLIPLTVYIKGEKIKLEFALARGRKKAGKKELIKKRETKKEISRELKARG